MASNGGPSRILMFVGGMMSLFYVLFGIVMFLGRFNIFNLDISNQRLLGGAIVGYGIFRLYLFIQRFKQMRNEE
jgi:hypothetical protein